jgi:GNAT superfamily N-acetyltransferase
VVEIAEEGVMVLTIESGGHWPDDAERIIRDLPEWFGMEDANAAYVEAARVLPTFVARRGDKIVGVCLVRRHNPVSAEIELLAVTRSHHRQGIGRQLSERVERDLRDDGVVLLQVKTFGPSGVSEEYARTRAFYASVGFVPLEERIDIWGPDNPCLISVKPLA